MGVDITFATPRQREGIEFFILGEFLNRARRGVFITLGSDGGVIHDGGGATAEAGRADAGFTWVGTGVLGLQHLVASESCGDHECRRRSDSDDRAGVGPAPRRPGGANAAT